MITLSQATRATPDTGQQLPQPWTNLRNRAVNFRRGELHMLAARPAQGKSAFALATALKMGVPTLYLCPDTTATTQFTRLMANHQQRPVWEMEQLLKDDPERAQEIAREAHPLLRWEFDVETLDDVDQQCMAWQEVFGDPPALLILDNLIDITSGEADEWSSSRKTLRELKMLAKELSTAVLVLHHVGEGDNTKKDGAPASKDILGRDNRLAAVVMTMAVDAGNIAAIAVVKNRYGPSDPKAENPVSFYFDKPKMSFEEGWGVEP